VRSRPAFLDELPEFQRQTLDVLREPVASGEVLLTRASGTLRYPARAQIVGSMNPCPCGHFGSARLGCKCSADSLKRYAARVPDLFDMVVRVDSPVGDDGSRASGETSAVVAARVRVARESPPRSDKPDEYGGALLNRAVEKLDLNRAAVDRVLRVARTIASLDTADVIGAPHVAEALQYAPKK
jgi:magnesium chelatase family protein